MSVPKFEPTQFTAGDTVTWEKSLADYDAADGWTVQYALRGPASYAISGAQIVSTGTTHTATISAATSATYTAGDYWLFGYAVKVSTGERVQFFSGGVTINVNQVTATGVYDGRTHVQKVLDAIEAAMEGRASREEQGYSINAGGIQRQIQFCLMADLIAAQTHYLALRRSEVDAERIAAGKKPKNKIFARFV